MYRKFRSYLKGEARDTWLKLIKDQPILAINKYTTDNIFGVENFIYANPEEPHLCVVLALTRPLFTYPQLLKKDASLFQGML